MYVMSEVPCATRFLGHLGAELKDRFSETLQAPLPSRLQELIDRLDEATGSNSDRDDNRSSRR